MNKRRKIVISKGYGSGWATEAGRANAQQVAEYKPLIKYLEAGGSREALNEGHPLIRRMVIDLGLYGFMCMGRDGLEVVQVTPPYIIEHYDGSEYVIEASELWD